MVPSRRLGPSVALVALVVVVLVAGSCSSDDDDPAIGAPATTVVASTTSTGSGGPTTTTPAAPEPGVHRIEIELAEGRIIGPERVKVPQGEEVHLVVRGDLDDEIHVHGYERTVALRRGAPAELRFVADLPGVWEVELHEAGRILVELEVSQ